MFRKSRLILLVIWGCLGGTGLSLDGHAAPPWYAQFTPGRLTHEGKLVDSTGLTWSVALGSESHGAPRVADGKVYVGTNNRYPGAPDSSDDKGVLLCVEAATGRILWRYAVPKWKDQTISDRPDWGLASPLTIADQMGYLITNRGEVAALDLNDEGLEAAPEVSEKPEGGDPSETGEKEDESKSDEATPKSASETPEKNQPITEVADEADQEKATKETPAEAGETASVAVTDPPVAERTARWAVDMPRELGVFPHMISAGAVALTDRYLYVNTSNGVDWSHLNRPAPQSPALVVLDRQDGRVVAEETAGISANTWHANWSPPLVVPDLAGKATVLYGGGDGVLYAFHASDFLKGKGAEQPAELKLLWQADACPPQYRQTEAGKEIRYPSYPGPSEIIAAPAVEGSHIYVVIGQDPEHGEGVGALTCINAEAKHEYERIGWQFKEIGRSLATPIVKDGLVFAVDLAGVVYCLDAVTGEKQWEHRTGSTVHGALALVGEVLLVGGVEGKLSLLKAGRQRERLREITFPEAIQLPQVVDGGALYVMTINRLYRFEIEP